ncbi:MAG: hypothetical protein IAI50_05760 [Candidatus Eremiobacteraeota bacterium]|nr:hypothetical protein [Candidatus Eremiobacteraeota bacterium]
MSISSSRRIEKIYVGEPPSQTDLEHQTERRRRTERLPGCADNVSVVDPELAPVGVDDARRLAPVHQIVELWPIRHLALCFEMPVEDLHNAPWSIFAEIGGNVHRALIVAIFMLLTAFVHDVQERRVVPVSSLGDCGDCSCVS